MWWFGSIIFLIIWVLIAFLACAGRRQERP